MELVNKTGRDICNGDHIWRDQNTWIVTDLPDRNYTPPEGYPNALWQGRLRDDTFRDVHVLLHRAAKGWHFTSFPDNEDE